MGLLVEDKRPGRGQLGLDFRLAFFSTSDRSVPPTLVGEPRRREIGIVISAWKGVPSLRLRFSHGARGAGPGKHACNARSANGSPRRAGRERDSDAANNTPG